MTDANLCVTSEIGKLRKVIVHAPGNEWDLVPCGPGALEQYLVEDIFVLPQAQKEHKVFTDVLECFLGTGNVLEFEELLAEVCSDPVTRAEIVAAVSAVESLGQAISNRLLDPLLRPRDLAKALISGAIIVDDDKRSYVNEFAPLPNLMFTRDLGVMTPGGFIICHAAKEARRRETLLMRYVLKHPIFTGTTILDLRDESNDIFWFKTTKKNPSSIEGGDVLVVDDTTLMIGTGERTTETGLITLVKTLVRNQSPIKTIIRVLLPEERASMHLDTVFTFINRNELVFHSPVLASTDAEAIVYSHPFRSGPPDEIGPLPFSEAMQSTKLRNPTTIKCGGENILSQSREQWTDGANLLAIAPGIAVGYDRNLETVRALQQHGYRYLEAKKRQDMREIKRLAEKFKRGKTTDKLIIGIPGSELSRARGGPRCMTLPLIRD